jgi:hypothetical protein
MRELPETLKVGAILCRPQEPAELVRLDFDKFDGVPILDELVILIARHIEPFIIGVGKVLIYETPKRLKVISRDGRGVNNGHVTSALAHSCGCSISGPISGTSEIQTGNLVTTPMERHDPGRRGRATKTYKIP